MGFLQVWTFLVPGPIGMRLFCRSERECSPHCELSLNSCLVLEAGLPRAALRCRPLNSTLAELIKPRAQSAATLLNQTLVLCTHSLEVLNSHHFKAIFSENQQFFISFRMKASRTLGRLLCNLFKNCFLVFPTELGNIAVPKKKKKKNLGLFSPTSQFQDQSLHSFSFRDYPKLTLLTERNCLFSQPHFPGACWGNLYHLKFSVFSPSSFSVSLQL